MFKEFQEFIARGNVIDMAVGIVVGAAFTAIVTSLVGDIINPVLALITGGLDFSAYYVVLGDADYATLQEAEAAKAPVIKYGMVINAVIKFLLVAFVVFLLVKQINNIKKRFEEKAADPENTEVPTPKDIQLLTEIRDLLKAKK